MAEGGRSETLASPLTTSAVTAKRTVGFVGRMTEKSRPLTTWGRFDRTSSGVLNASSEIRRTQHAGEGLSAPLELV